MTRARCLSISIALLLALPLGAAAQGNCQSVDLGQGWSDADREDFWFLSQGSRLLDYRWFLYLEEAASTTPFRNTLEQFGFIGARPSRLNPDGLPIGFARDDEGSNAAVGLTCAACHTSRIRLKGEPVIVEGAPALSDFTEFLRTLEKVLVEHTTGDKFDRFQKNVLGPNASEQQKDDLKKQVSFKATELANEWNRHWPTHGGGPGRLDAFGPIYNRVVAYLIEAPQNAKEANAPVSYPYLWNTPQHDVVQWNGSASNGLLGLGPLIRNVGEALGVFGAVTLAKTKTPDYSSSLRIPNIKTLEEIVRTLRPPAWPRGCAPVNADQVETGIQVYRMHCSRCHQNLDRSDLTTTFKAKMVSLSDVGTDRTMAGNFARNFKDTRVATGELKGQRKTFFFFSKFGDTARGREILANVILGTVIGGGADARLTTEEQRADASLARKITEQIQEANLTYKARPLNGIWATAPYLHNGSVPNLAELLKPPADRMKTFYVGGTEFDFTNVGLSTASQSGAVLLDTRVDGNFNSGHTYGVALSSIEKEALLQYLKVIGERVQD